MQINKGKIARKFLHIFAFFPFIGWLFPLFLLPDNKTAQQNSKISLVLSIYALCGYLILNFADFFTPQSAFIAVYSINIAIYALLALYFLLLLIGAVFAFKNRVYKLPLFFRKANDLPL